MQKIDEPTALYVSALTIYQLGKEGSLRKDIVQPRLGEAELKCKDKISALEAEIKAYETVLNDIQEMYFDEFEADKSKFDGKTMIVNSTEKVVPMTTFLGKKQAEEMSLKYEGKHDGTGLK